MRAVQRLFMITAVLLHLLVSSSSRKNDPVHMKFISLTSNFMHLYFLGHICCSYEDDIDQLLSCTRENVILASNSRPEVTVLSLVTKGSGRFKIDGIESFGAYHLALLHAYSSKHGYRFKPRVSLSNQTSLSYEDGNKTYICDSILIISIYVNINR